MNQMPWRRQTRDRLVRPHPVVEAATDEQQTPREVGVTTESEQCQHQRLVEDDVAVGVAVEGGARARLLRMQEHPAQHGQLSRRGGPVGTREDLPAEAPGQLVQPRELSARAVVEYRADGRSEQ